MRKLCRALGSSMSASLLLLLLPAALVAQGNDGANLEKCEKPFGALAVVEPQNEIIIALQRYKLQSPTSLIRMMVQQSNCFVVVERGAAMANLKQERDLAASGMAQQGSNIGGGQLKVADFVLTPTVLFSEGNAGGIGGMVGGLGARALGLGAIAGGLKFKEAQTSMLIADTRSGIQVASAEGKATKKDFSLGALGWGGGVFGAVGGYTNTNEGKVVAASFLDNFNNIVINLRKSDLKPATAGAAGGSGDNVKAGVAFNEGDVLRPKIDNIKLLAEPKDGAKAGASVSKSDELVFLGEEKDGYVHVQGSAGEGWVKKTLVGKGGGMEMSASAGTSASGGISAAFVGDWQGVMYQRGTTIGQALRFSLSKGSSTGSNLTVNCSANLAYLEASDTRAFYRLDPLSGRCPAGILLEFISVGPGRLDLKVHVAGTVGSATDQTVLGSASLTKG